MAMNSGSLANELKAAIMAALAADYANPADDENLTGYDFDTYMTKWTTAVATTIVNHITANAKATGTDSRGDSHDLSII